MFSKTTVAITGLLALAQAIKVTNPAKGDEWDASSSNEITWDTVNTDPKEFEIVVVNQSGFPEVSTTVAKVNSADGKYELKDADLPAGGPYRINFISTDRQNSGILAQSEQFSVTDDSDDTSSSASASATASASASGSASASASASATGSSSAATATATVTQTSSGLITVTGSATATATASGTAASNASGSGTASGTASGAASGTATGSAASASPTAPSSASALKSTLAIFGSVAVAAYMLF
ncbi:GPI-anchored membrane protein [Colletotrichum tanaceti]|uniref:GPI-anchored membrane protein n=1 Tax=Colletotrichum tanaceti TaxID=1306861 RepID=A0A4U6XAQ6_9PEZI|nr:GPI-anchored membrane protein [Colletotrichum tanaceti]TKW52434.1 GPI-anchored membrane protein [Colletotrichum tanaceti]